MSENDKLLGLTTSPLPNYVSPCSQRLPFYKVILSGMNKTLEEKFCFDTCDYLKNKALANAPVPVTANINIEV